MCNVSFQRLELKLLIKSVSIDAVKVLCLVGITTSVGVSASIA